MDYPILILHGWGRGSVSWLKVKEVLEQKGFKVFVPDMPGFGKEPIPSEPWDVKNYTDWVLNFAQQNKLEKFFLLGHSFGGRVAIKFSALYPEKIEKIILVASAGINREKNLSITQKIIRKSKGIGDVIKKVPLLKYLHPLFRKLAYIISGTRDYYSLNDPIMKETFKKTIVEDLTHHLSDIKSPTLIVWGKKDKLVLVETAYFIQKNIKNSQLEVFNDVGHRVNQECPERLVEVVEKFIKL